jgi:hypothetical protein
MRVLVCVVLCMALHALVARVGAQNGNGVTTLCVQKELCAPGCVNTNANGTCYECGLDFYKTTTGSTACLACPANTTTSSITNVAYAHHCRCGAGHTGPSGGPCTICPAGTSKYGSGSHACSGCASGQYSDTVGADRCKECPMGTYTLPGANSVCVQCPGNSTTGIIGAPSASYCKCNLGFIGPPAPLDPRAPPCTPCPAGTDRQSRAAGSCIECEPGTYAAAPGTPFCLECPVSKYADGYGNTACMDCAVGYTGPTGGPCVACAAAKYKDSVGSAACTACLERTTSPEASTSSSACLCNAGFYLFSSNMDELNCVACEPGYYQDQTGATACKQCPPGTSSDWEWRNTGPVTCTGCPVGTGFDRVTNACVSCANNTVWSDDSSACECAPGFGFA